MAYQLNPWGYETDGAVPPLIDVDEFDALTGDKWAYDTRVPYAIAAASAAIRNACGWHVYPSKACRIELDGTGYGSFMLPTTCLTGVTSVEVMGEPADGIQWSRIGQLLVSGHVPCALRAVAVEYAAGYPSLPDDLKQLVADMVVRGIALSYGVTSESSGDVSVSYAGAAAGSASASLVDADLARISAYRAVKAHAV